MSLPRFLKHFGIGLAVVLAVTLLAAVITYVINRDIVNGYPLAVVPPGSSLATEFGRAEVASPYRLEACRVSAEKLGSSAVIALHDGKLVAEWGASDRRISGHSVRKNLVSALYGIAVNRGLIDTGKTLAELGIDDMPPLSKQERRARLVDLLTCRSGIYRSSVKADLERNRPAPGAHAPGTHFYYNNWGFNALGSIFEKATGLSLGKAFKEWIADPVGMQDFQVGDVRYFEGKESIFPAYRFWISARDLARLGQLYLNRGRWGDREVIPASWIDVSTTARSDVGDGFGYAFMWWTTPTEAYFAAGTGAQMLYVDPGRSLVVVNRVWTGEPGIQRGLWFWRGPRVREPDIRALADSIYAAALGAEEVL